MWRCRIFIFLLLLFVQKQGLALDLSDPFDLVPDNYPDDMYEQTQRDIVTGLEDAVNDVTDAINKPLADIMDVKPTSSNTREKIASDFNSSIALMIKQADSAGSVAGLCEKASQDIDKLKEKIKTQDELKKQKNNPDISIDDLAKNLLLIPIPEPLKEIVMSKGDEAQEKLKKIAALFSGLGDNLPPYNFKKTYDQIANSDSTLENIEIPIGTIIPIWQTAIELHFANALSQNSATEFQRGLNLMNLTIWQLENKPKGFVYSVNIPKENCPTGLPSKIPVIGGVMTAPCDWNDGNVLGVGSTLIAPVGLTKDILKNGAIPALKTILGDVGKDEAKETFYDSLGDPDENENTENDPDKKSKNQQTGEQGVNNVGDKIDDISQLPVDNRPIPPRLKPHPSQESQWPESQYK